NKNTVLPKLPNVVSNSLSKIIHYIPRTDMKQIQLKFVIENNTDQFAVKPNGYVNYLLANEMPGSLASVLRDAGLSEAVYADFNASMYGDHGDLTLYIDLTEDGVNNRDKVMAAALKYINLLKEHGVNEKYFKEIKQSLKNIFRFKEQSNDFEYAMQIAANLQKVPVEYVLSHEYTYQQFNSNAIQQVLDQLTLDNARIFYIDKEQPAEQAMEHFVGMYSVSNISNKQRQDWSTLGDEFSLFLPRENKLMPSHFDLVPAVHIGKPKQLVNQLGYTSHLGHSRLFEQPKGKINIELNTGLTQQSAKNFVLANVLSKTLNQKMTELQSEAITAGMNVDIDVSNGFSIIISGFSHKQSELLERTLTTISQLTITQSNLLNNIASFESDIRSSKNHILLEQLFPKFRQVLNLDNFSDQAILNELEGITPQQVITFKNELLKQANLQIFAFGNYTAEQVKDMGDLVLKVLPEDRQVSEFYLSPELKASAGEIYTWQEDVSIDDVAFADTYMAPLTVKDLAVAHVLNEIINPALFKQIRTEEQLAYTVGFFSQRIKEQLLLGYYIQSPAKGLADIQERILAFRGDFSNLLNDYSEAEFSAYKNSLLTRIKQPAKNLAEEHSQYLADWRLQNHLFDSEDKLIFQVENVTLKDVIGLYKKIETGQKFGRLLVQLRGANFTDKPYIQPSGGHIINDIESFHHDELEKVK
ncbi:insulinase family protein, partial [Paraglaciecola sp.]|uniref:insulinase family protein n=1 Tax=Paraglaciecola sp. TaxID=1920173 RepID=UPI003EF2D816